MVLSESQLRAGKVWSGPFSSSSQSVGWASWMATRPHQSRRPLIMGTGIVPPAPLISKESLSHLQIQIALLLERGGDTWKRSKGTAI